MKNKTVMGIVLTILLLSIIAFSCCVDERTQLPTSSASGIEITVKYPDSWKGELYDLEHLRIVEGTGKKSFHQAKSSLWSYCREFLEEGQFRKDINS